MKVADAIDGDGHEPGAESVIVFEPSHVPKSQEEDILGEILRIHPGTGADISHSEDPFLVAIHEQFESELAAFPGF